MPTTYQVTYHSAGNPGSYIDGPVFSSLKSALASIPGMMDVRLNNDRLSSGFVINAETGEVILEVNLIP